MHVFTRAFSASSTAPKKHSKRRLQHMMRNIPPYPYPPQHTFKQAWFGLYGGKHIQFGNNVPESRYKTRRRWLPNVRHRSVYSRVLAQHFSIDITASVLRTIDKVGGLDAYLTGSKPARIRSLGPTGWRLRWRVMTSPRYQAQLAEERKALGLDVGAMPQVSMFGYGDMPGLELQAGAELELQAGAELQLQARAGLERQPRAALLEAVPVEELQPQLELELEPEPEVVKTRAQLLVEKIERSQGLRK